MKTIKFLPLIVFTFSQLLSFSQVTLTPAMMPLANDTIFYKRISNFNGDAEPTGENYVWDFSIIEANNWVADTFVSVSSTPLAYNISFNNPSAPKYKATVASPQADINVPIGGFNFSNIYYYFKLAGDTLFSQVGQAVTVNNIPLPIRFDDIDFMYHFPSSFGDYDTCFSSYSVSIPQIGFNSRKQTRYNFYDGYGTLITPIDTFQDVIRVKTIILSRDSIYSDQYNMPFAFNTTTTEYKWFVEGHRNPVFNITTTQGQGQPRTTLKYIDTPEPIPYSIRIIENQKMEIYPNPFSEKIDIKISETSFPCNISIKDILGRNIFQKSCTSSLDLIEISQHLISLQNGLYIIRCTTTEGEFLKKVIKK